MIFLFPVLNFQVCGLCSFPFIFKKIFFEIENYENEDNKKNKIQYIKNTSLWARAFAESDGDEVKQKVIYVKLRSEELDNDYDFEYKRKLSKKQGRNAIVFIIIIVFVLLLINQIQ